MTARAQPLTTSAQPGAAALDALLAAGRQRRAAGLARASLAAALAAVAGVGLLGLAGWFLAGAALAGAAGGAALAAYNYLLPSAGIRLAAVVRTGGRYLERLWSHAAALATLAELRPALFARAAARDPRRLAAMATAEGLARLTGDVDALEDAIIRAPAGPAALAGAVLAVLLALCAGWQPALVMALGLAALAPAARQIARRHIDTPAAAAREAAGALKAATTAVLAAGAEIAVYGLAEAVSADIAALAAAMDRERSRMARGDARLAGLLVAAGPALAALVALAAAAAGASAALAALAALAAAGAAEAQGSWHRARAREAAVASAHARLAALAEVPEPEANPDPLPQAAGESLLVGGHALAPGGRLALIGRSGSGKTRLLETLAGWRADAPETLLVAGEPAISTGFAALAARFALAPQAPALLAGTIADNLRLAAPGLADEALWAALEVACLADDVRALPAGLAEWLGEGAGQFSGGQRKRLALARALLAGRPWLLLDEPTEGLDAATEAQLVARLGHWLDATGTGLILASHRAAPLALAPARLHLG